MASRKWPELRIRDTAEQVASACSEYILSALKEALQSQPAATIALSGGSSPKLLFAAMAKADFNWSRVNFFWVDERCVPPLDDRSNFKLANDTLLIPAHVPEQNIHRIQGELPPEEASAKYIADIKNFFSLKDGELPAFDVLHRGMGPDAHTASLFPDEPLIQNHTDIAAHVWVEKVKMDRVTLLPGVLMAAKRTVLQVSGEEKTEALRNVLTGEEDPMKYPCQIASRDERAIWFLDKAAAADL
jgi:6-phosphogluconolactonase